ncbi:hypothetical protein MTAT_19010 [Moorella thermoacetica]|uniref:Actin-like protein N-terminal domain-containing protein n=1 Tax=Neomoorella thermoacetica TaxID=1525 RepID=A0AAC9HIW4_NEOTH|nr:ParM/StbA family protein [Moorella thermoacetica]AOQ24558.1 hypothetical protein Maut_02128 [Moorella thermoacetica]TYL12659.1 hypothetical protein MTAT_19010 [Moorella thermoacetica]
MLVGIDLGYGQIKVVSDKQKVKFPSVVGTPSAIELSDGSQLGKYQPINDITINYQGKRYYVGQKAINETTNARLTLKADKTDAETNIIKYLAGLALVGAHGETMVVTGLPVYEYNLQKDKLAKSLTGSFNFSFYNQNNGQNVSLDVAKCQVIPQAAAAYYNAILNTTGQIKDMALAAARVAVVDIGYRTTDVVTMEGGKYDSNRSFTIWTGMGKVHQEVMRYLQREYQLSYKLADMDVIVRQGYIDIHGGRRPIDNFIRAALEPVAQEIIEGVIAGLEDFRKLSGGLLLAGGGASLMEPYFTSEFGDAVQTLPDCEFANAVGNYCYGILVTNRG